MREEKAMVDPWNAYHNTQEVRQLIHETKMTQRNLHEQEPTVVAQLLDAALDTTENVLRFLQDEIPIELVLDAFANSSQIREGRDDEQPVDLTCICPHCKKYFQHKTTEFALLGPNLEDAIGGSRREWKREVTDMQQKWALKRETFRQKVEEELYEFSVPKLQSVLESLNRVQREVRDKRGFMRPERDFKKQQYLALYEELMQEKYELEMTRQLQHRIEGMKINDKNATNYEQIVRPCLGSQSSLVDLPLIIPPMVVESARSSPHVAGVESVVPLRSPRADKTMNVFKTLGDETKMYPGFQYAGYDSVPGFTPSMRSGADTPMEY